MGLIPANQARGLFTQKLVTVYKQLPTVQDWLAGFFPARTSDTRYIYWAVRREGEPVAVNVLRGTEGNRNTFSIETDKIVDPPYYREYFDLTQTDLYYRAFNSELVDESVMSDYMAWAVEHLQSLHNKIKRALEYQRAQVLQTGIVTLAQGETVDFKRRAGSMLAYNASRDFSINTVNPFNVIESLCKEIRTFGKAEGGNFLCIMGDSVFNALLTNTIYLERQRTYNMKLDDLRPQLRVGGAAYHGRIDCGNYTVDLFTYPQYYDTGAPGTTATAYIDPKKLIVIPDNASGADFMTGFGAVPFLPKRGQSGLDISLPQIQKGQYVVGDYVDERNTAWIMDIKSAGIVLPTAIDKIASATILS